MLMVISKRLNERGEVERAELQLEIAKRVIDAFSDDFIEDKWFSDTVYGYLSEQRREIEGMLR